MQIKIGTLHVEEKSSWENHTSYAADWRAYTQAVQDVPLYVSVEGGYTIPMPTWILAGWEITVTEEHLFSGYTGVISGERVVSEPYTAQKGLQTWPFCLSDMNFTPDPSFPDSELLAKQHVEWARKHAPTWAAAQELKEMCQ